MATKSHSESLWQTALGATGIGEWSWDLSGDTVVYSAEWKQLRGCLDHDVGNSITESLRRVHVDDRVALEAKRAGLVLGQNDSFSHDYRVQHTDESWIWVEERTRALRDKSGEVVRLIGCEIDITQRKQDEAKPDDEFNAALFDSLPVAISRIENQQCVYVNEYWSQLTGRSRESALGTGWKEAIHPDDRGQIARKIAPYKEGSPGSKAEIDGIEGRHLNPDGSINWFVAKLRLRYGMDGVLASSTIVILDVTDRKQLEQKQERLNEILEATSDFIGIATPDCKILWHNKQLAALRPDLKPGENADFSVAHPEWSRTIMAEVAIPAAIEDGSWSGKMAIFDQEGNEIPVSQVLIAHKGSDGKVEAISTIMRDISEQEKTERALRLSERNYASLASTAPVGIFRMSDTQNCIYVNEHWRKMTGLASENALGTGWMSGVSAEDLKEFGERAKKFANDSNQVIFDGYETKMILADGKPRWVQCHLAKETDDDGNVTGFVGTLNDIDRVKRAEEQLKEVNQRLQNVLEASSIGIWDWSCAEERLIWDEKMHEIYGVAVEDFRGIHSDWSDRVHPDDLERVLAEERRGLEANPQHAVEFRIVRPNGEVRHIYANAHTQSDEHGTLLRITGVNVDITERREAEFALLESESKFQRIVKNLPGMVYSYFLDSDGESGWTFLSDQAQELFGFAPSELMADRERLWKLIEPGDKERLTEKMHESVKELSRFVEEFRITNSEGTTRWYQANSQPRNAENGRVVWDGVILEITDRKTAEIALRDTTRQLDRITENVPGMIYQIVHLSDGTEVTSFVSPKCRDMFGLTPEGLMNDHKLLAAAVYSGDKEKMRDAIAKSEGNLQPLNVEFRVLLPEKGLRWYQTVTEPLPTENGDVVWNGVVLDVTDRKIAQLALEDAKAQIERITDNVPGMIFQYVLRADGTHASLYSSPQSLELHGLTPDQVMGDVDLVFDMFHPDDIGSVREAIAESARTLQPLKAEYRVTVPGKGLRWQQVNGQPTRTDTGDTIWDGIATDITHRKQAELQLQLANDELARATKMKDEFLANMSHELRTPLSAILGMTEGFQQGLFGAATPKQQDGFDVIQQSASHLLALIDEILDLAKIESGALELEFHTINIRELCESSLRLVAPQADKKNIDLNLSVSFNLPSIEADEKRMRQVLINLLSNAVKFTPSNGQVKLEVERLEPDSDRGQETLRLSVTDTGIGIDESKFASLFLPFIQVDSSLSRNYEGTGLGLALVKQFVELHSGHVGVTSQLGVGTCFRVDIPLRQSRKHLAKPREVNCKPPFIASHTSEKSAFVLLAEDNELVAKATTDFLEASNFQVQLVTDGQAAIDTARERQPDVILMDIQMPGVDGLEAIRRLREIPALRQTPIVALTGLAMPEDAKRCLAAGASVYLSKPYGMQELVNTILELLTQNTPS